MSTGKSYAKMEASDAERLAEVERKFEVIRGRISAYDQVLDEFKKIKEEIASFPTDIQEVHKKIASSDSRHADSLKGIKQDICNVAKTIEEYPKKISLLEEAFFSNCQHIEDVARDLAFVAKDTQEKLDQISSDKITKSAFDEFSKLQSEQLYDIRGYQKASESKFMEELDHVAGLISDHHGKLDEVERLKAQIAQFSVWMSTFEDKIAKKLQDSFSLFEKSQKEHRDLTQDALSQMKQEIIGTPTSNASVEARIMNRLEMASLDGSNAVLKANSMAEKVKLLEKKIEALTTQLNSYALPR